MWRSSFDFILILSVVLRRIQIQYKKIDSIVSVKKIVECKAFY